MCDAGINTSPCVRHSGTGSGQDDDDDHQHDGLRVEPPRSPPSVRPEKTLVDQRFVVWRDRRRSSRR